MGFMSVSEKSSFWGDDFCQIPDLYSRNPEKCFDRVRENLRIAKG